MHLILPFMFLLWGFSGAAFSQAFSPAPILPDALHWAGPPDNPALEGAWVLGSEQAQGAYIRRVRLAAEGRMAPHAHPDTRNSTVLSGTLYVGFGEIFDESRLVAVPAGGVYVAPANVMHYIWAKDGKVEYQESGVGPTATLMTGAVAVQQQVQESPLAAISWLAGCWRHDSAEAGSGEQWLVPAGGSMLGAGRTVKNGKMLAYEYMSIQTTREGKIIFVARPSGQQEASFEMLSLSPDAIEFENLQHDFPQRISYRKLSDDRIFGHIEGEQDGVVNGIDFPMNRISCESPVKP